MHTAPLDCLRALPRTGKSKEAKIPIIATTTSNSISVNFFIASVSLLGALLKIIHRALTRYNKDLQKKGPRTYTTYIPLRGKSRIRVVLTEVYLLIVQWTADCKCTEYPWVLHMYITYMYVHLLKCALCGRVCTCMYVRACVSCAVCVSLAPWSHVHWDCIVLYCTCALGLYCIVLYYRWSGDNIPHHSINICVLCTQYMHGATWYMYVHT